MIKVSTFGNISSFHFGGQAHIINNFLQNNLCKVVKMHEIIENIQKYSQNNNQNAPFESKWLQSDITIPTFGNISILHFGGWANTISNLLQNNLCKVTKKAENY